MVNNAKQYFVVLLKEGDDISVMGIFSTSEQAIKWTTAAIERDKGLLKTLSTHATMMHDPEDTMPPGDHGERIEWFDLAHGPTRLPNSAVVRFQLGSHFVHLRLEEENTVKLFSASSLHITPTKNGGDMTITASL